MFQFMLNLYNRARFEEGYFVAFKDLPGPPYLRDCYCRTCKRFRRIRNNHPIRMSGTTGNGVIA